MVPLTLGEVVMGKRKTIAVLVGQAYEYYQASVIEGFLTEMFAADVDVCTFACYEKYQNTAAREIGETAIFKLIPYERFDGFVLMLDTLQTPGLSDNIMNEIRSRVKVPVITIDKLIEDYVCVMPNDRDGIKAVISHLIEEHGYKDIAFLTGKSWHPYSKIRLKAFQECMEEHGLKVRDNRIFFGDFWYTSGENLGDKFAKMNGPLPQAVACANDCMAVGLAKSLIEHGIRIPEDIAVVGYDSSDEGRYAPKPITSVTLPAKPLGVHAAKTILAMINGEELPEFEESVHMFLGSSCGCVNEKATMVSRLRDTWATDLSSNSVFSPFNHMDEDLLSQSTFLGLMNTVFSYTFQIRDYRNFSLCLNADWQHYNTGNIRSSEPFTQMMMHVLYSGIENEGMDKICVNEFFNKSELVPEFNEERDKPVVFYFTPIYFENMTFGYAAISYDQPHSHSEAYRIWLRSVMRGLEFFREQDELRTMNAKLEANLVREPLTGFYNFKGFQNQADSILKMMKNRRENCVVNILAIDIKNLSGINNSLGRTAGDQAIVQTAEFIRGVSGGSNVFALGNGEYFILIFSQDEKDTSYMKIKEDLQEKMKEFNESSTAFQLDFSYGHSQGTPTSQGDFERLVSIAVNNKNIRKRNLEKAEEGGILTEDEQAEAKVVHDIIENNRINYHFQPIVIASTGEIYAYEALMRADVEPYMAPPVVLRYAEFFNRLYDIEKATFNNVLDIFGANGDSFAEGSKVFINSIPGHVLKDTDFEEVTKKMEGISDRFVVEFTEQTEVPESEMAKIKKRYEDAGIQTAIDDYGTGYSNISNLLAYMPNYVKIDRMLLSDIQHSPQKQHFVKDIIAFSHENGILALAEGVETIEEYKVVLELGADLVQGYFVARPSAKVIKEIDPDIKKQIIDLSLAVNNEASRDTYVAGREGRLSLPVLVEEGYNKIIVPNAEVTYRDITISGAPGFDTDIYINVEDGYQGTIVLENAGLSGMRTGSSISVGEGCDVTFEIVGENVLNNGGIRVPSSSRVVFTGDGFIKINVQRLEAYGIGNALLAEHGDLVFDQDGTIEINIDSTQGIGIGSGYGGDIHINSGKYIINMHGQSGVAIGSILKGTQPVVANCDCHINNSALRCVGIGSVEGDCDVLIDKLSFHCNIAGEEGVGIGTISGGKCNIGVTNALVIMDATANKLMCIGSHRSWNTVTRFNLSTVNCEFTGTDSSFIGSFDPNAKINISNCTIAVNGRSDNEDLFAAKEENVVFSHCKCTAMINAKDKTRVNFES